jgi:hypothetical protein
VSCGHQEVCILSRSKTSRLESFLVAAAVATFLAAMTASVLFG